MFSEPSARSSPESSDSQRQKIDGSCQGRGRATRAAAQWAQHSRWGQQACLCLGLAQGSHSAPPVLRWLHLCATSWPGGVALRSRPDVKGSRATGTSGGRPHSPELPASCGAAAQGAEPWPHTCTRTFTHTYACTHVHAHSCTHAYMAHGFMNLEQGTFWKVTRPLAVGGRSGEGKESAAQGSPGCLGQKCH